ncbi:MAG TPA: hypothetical protein VK783_16355 [Bacteroidia bacterium]|jgi:hypothetical protein|nr:hypothetical protein [Bacteroidia bacterium]
MNQTDFAKLNINERADLTWSKGEFVGTREYYSFKLSLYVLKGLYVKVWYFPTTNRIEKVEPLANIKDLNHYLKDIDLAKLLDGYPYSENE